MVDHFSGYPFIAQLSSLSANAIIRRINAWFQVFGYPETLRTDFGPQFRGEFGTFCQEHGIKHEVSSPYFPRSNGLAESAVKNMKHLIIKCDNNFEKFQPALAQWKNTKRAERPSPNELFLGRLVRLDNPVLLSSLKFTVPITDVSKDPSTSAELNNPDGTGKRLRPLGLSRGVWIQDNRTKRWNIKARITALPSHADPSYHLQGEDGHSFRRNRIHIRPRLE